MLSDVIHALACPVCAGELRLAQHALRCDLGHSFDVAREGYVNLLHGGAKASTADTAAMVEARASFLRAGHFDPVLAAIARTVASAVPADVPGVIADAGGGTGDYLAAVLSALPERAGISLDISKQAARVAARMLPHGGSVVADVWGRLPLRDASVAALLDIFAPRNASEFARVLAPGGALVVVTPEPEHLRELVEALDLITIDPDKADRLAATLDPLFTLESAHVVSGPLDLTADEALAAVWMGPSAAHFSAEEIARRLGSLTMPVCTGFSARIGVYRVR